MERGQLVRTERRARPSAAEKPGHAAKLNHRCKGLQPQRQHTPPRNRRQRLKELFKVRRQLAGIGRQAATNIT
jgi:hypothetical protein